MACKCVAVRPRPIASAAGEERAPAGGESPQPEGGEHGHRREKGQRKAGILRGNAGEIAVQRHDPAPQQKQHSAPTQLPRAQEHERGQQRRQVKGMEERHRVGDERWEAVVEMAVRVVERSAHGIEWIPTHQPSVTQCGRFGVLAQIQLWQKDQQEDGGGQQQRGHDARDDPAHGGHGNAGDRAGCRSRPPIKSHARKYAKRHEESGVYPPSDGGDRERYGAADEPPTETALLGTRPAQQRTGRQRPPE